MFRQGDVLIVPCAAIPAKAKELDREGGRVVLAHGEVTGHAHAFMSSRATLFREDGTGSGGGTFLRVSGDRPAALEHEEHTTIHVPPGDYRVIRQREYSPAAIRTVAD